MRFSVVNHAGRTAGWSTVLRVVIWQSIITVIAANLFYIKGTAYALGALAGGGISIATGMLFAVNLFMRGGIDDPRQMVAALYTAESLKFILSVGLFILAAVHFREAFLAVIVTYWATVLLYWLGLLFRQV